jgi:hypothetical protein
MLTLTTPFSPVQFPRIIFLELHPNDDVQILSYEAQLWSGLAANALVCSTGILTIANGTSSLLTRQTNPAAGLIISDRDRYFVVSSHATPTGYTDAMAVARAAANDPVSRRAALEAHIVATHFAANLAGGIS